MTTPKVLTPVEEMRSNFERTGTLAPMYARAMFVELTALTTTNKKLQSVADAARELEDYYGCDYALEAHVSDPNGDFTPCGNCRGCRVRLALAALKEEEG